MDPLLAALFWFVFNLSYPRLRDVLPLIFVISSLLISWLNTTQWTYLPSCSNHISHILDLHRKNFYAYGSLLSLLFHKLENSVVSWLVACKVDDYMGEKTTFCGFVRLDPSVTPVSASFGKGVNSKCALSAHLEKIEMLRSCLRLSMKKSTSWDQGRSHAHSHQYAEMNVMNEYVMYAAPRTNPNAPPRFPLCTMPPPFSKSWSQFVPTPIHLLSIFIILKMTIGGRVCWLFCVVPESVLLF